MSLLLTVKALKFPREYCKIDVMEYNLQESVWNEKALYDEEPRHTDIFFSFEFMTFQFLHVICGDRVFRSVCYGR